MNIPWKVCGWVVKTLTTGIKIMGSKQFVSRIFFWSPVHPVGNECSGLFRAGEGGEEEEKHPHLSYIIASTSWLSNIHPNTAIGQGATFTWDKFLDFFDIQV